VFSNRVPSCVKEGSKLFCPVPIYSTSTTYKVVQIWPGRFVCKQVTVCPGHIWTTLYIHKEECINIVTETQSKTMAQKISPLKFCSICTWIQFLYLLCAKRTASGQNRNNVIFSVSTSKLFMPIEKRYAINFISVRSPSGNFVISLKTDPSYKKDLWGKLKDYFPALQTFTYILILYKPCTLLY
jgi:hypothetical protein